MAKGGLHKFTVQEAQNAKMGQGGYDTGSVTEVAGVEYVAITALAAATVSTTSHDTSLFPDLSSVAVPVGATIYGRWKTVTEDSGTILVYKG